MYWTYQSALFHLNLLLFKWTFSVCWKFGKLFIWKSQCFFQCWFWMFFKYWIFKKTVIDQFNYYNTFKINSLIYLFIFLSYLSTILIHDFDYSWTQIKWIFWGRRQFYTALTYRGLCTSVFFCFFCFFILVPTTLWFWTKFEFRNKPLWFLKTFPTLKQTFKVEKS